MSEEKKKVDSSASLSRRDFIVGSGAVAGAALSGCATAAEQRESRPSEEPASHALPRFGPLVDVNVDLFRWPLRHLRLDEPDALARKLQHHGVVEAWAGSFEGLLHKDLAGVNERLVEACRESGRGVLVPFGSVNPVLPDWDEELRRCHEEHAMPGIRLHPGYQGYTLKDSRFARLLTMAAERGLVVQLAIQMEDERVMHPRLQVDPVDATPLPELVERTPGLRLVLLNALRHLRGAGLTRLIASGDVAVEIATLEGLGGIGRLLDQVPLSGVLFGSHAPLFYFESALLKLKETPLTDEQLHSIARTNARRTLGRQQ